MLQSVSHFTIADDDGQFCVIDIVIVFASQGGAVSIGEGGRGTFTACAFTSNSAVSYRLFYERQIYRSDGVVCVTLS